MFGCEEYSYLLFMICMVIKDVSDGLQMIRMVVK